jgi:hypothetical protein
VEQLFRAAELCIKDGLFSPVQMLILCCIDAFSWIEFDHISNSKDRFETWVNKRILPHDDVFCTEADLYAARSGVIHRLGTRSRLSECGKAQHISYSFGDADFKLLIELRESIRAETGRHIPIVRLEALYCALRKGVSGFLTEADVNPELKERFEEYLEAEQPFRFPS